MLVISEKIVGYRVIVMLSGETFTRASVPHLKIYHCGNVNPAAMGSLGCDLRFIFYLLNILIQRGKFPFRAFRMTGEVEADQPISYWVLLRATVTKRP